MQPFAAIPGNSGAFPNLTILAGALHQLVPSQVHRISGAAVGKRVLVALVYYVFFKDIAAWKFRPINLIDARLIDYV